MIRSNNRKCNVLRYAKTHFQPVHRYIDSFVDVTKDGHRDGREKKRNDTMRFSETIITLGVRFYFLVCSFHNLRFVVVVLLSKYVSHNECVYLYTL